jgi:hypothetical protein
MHLWGELVTPLPPIVRASLELSLAQALVKYRQLRTIADAAWLELEAVQGAIDGYAAVLGVQVTVGADGTPIITADDSERLEGFARAEIQDAIRGDE